MKKMHFICLGLFIATSMVHASRRALPVGAAGAKAISTSLNSNVSNIFHQQPFDNQNQPVFNHSLPSPNIQQSVQSSYFKNQFLSKKGLFNNKPTISSSDGALTQTDRKAMEQALNSGQKSSKNDMELQKLLSFKTKKDTAVVKYNDLGGVSVKNNNQNMVKNNPVRFPSALGGIKAGKFSTGFMPSNQLFKDPLATKTNPDQILQTVVPSPESSVIIGPNNLFSKTVASEKNNNSEIITEEGSYYQPARVLKNWRLRSSENINTVSNSKIFVDQFISAEPLPQQPSPWMILRFLQRIKDAIMQALASMGYQTSPAQDIQINTVVTATAGNILKSSEINQGVLDPSTVTNAAQTMSQKIWDIITFTGLRTENQV